MLTLTFLFFFFCKQKTAYEMRISDWSSDVCSSDLRKHVRGDVATTHDDLSRREVEVPWSYPQPPAEKPEADSATGRRIPWPSSDVLCVTGTDHYEKGPRQRCDLTGRHRPAGDSPSKHPALRAERGWGRHGRTAHFRS